VYIGGAGISNSITGSAVNYGAGGNGSSGTPYDSAVNVGVGGKSGYALAGRAGGSGVIIIRVVV
jgi:hypothetical protein